MSARVLRWLQLQFITSNVHVHTRPPWRVKSIVELLSLLSLRAPLLTRLSSLLWAQSSSHKALGDTTALPAA